MRESAMTALNPRQRLRTTIHKKVQIGALYGDLLQGFQKELSSKACSDPMSDCTATRCCTGHGLVCVDSAGHQKGSRCVAAVSLTFEQLQLKLETEKDLVVSGWKAYRGYVRIMSFAVLGVLILAGLHSCIKFMRRQRRR